MKPVNPKNQNGVALLIFVVMLMGMGGVVLVGYSQGVLKEVEESKFQHNQRVLKEAKQALLMYAYNYPTTLGRGPGRLPCPDIVNNDGVPDPLTAPACMNNNEVVGRFPYNAPGMAFYDARDASGERLWYAVSSIFDYGPSTTINSDSKGTITLFDQSQKIIYDGAVAGIAAIIIAPGPTASRDEDDDGIYEYTQVRGTVAERDDPRNYLDTLNDYDNSFFRNSSSASNGDGFILGPVREPDPLSSAYNTIVVNDQMIVITAAEVIEVAEKATLQAYRDAIAGYLARPGFNRYPWLDSYSSSDGLLTFDADVTPAAPAPVIGRVPSIFANYFSANLSQPIKSEIDFLLNIDSHQGLLRFPASAAPDIFFQANGDLRTFFNIGDTFTRYFWDGHDTTPDVNSPADGVWELCPVVTNDEEDCNRDASGDFKGGAASDVWLKVRLVTFTIAGVTFGDPFEVPFANKTATLIDYTSPDPANHGYITAEYSDSNGFFSSVAYSQDDDFLGGFIETPIGNNGNLTLAVADTISISLRYYPELPNWALVNGWHDMIQAGYSSALQPGGDGTCNAGVDDCLTLLSIAGVTNDKIALLVLSGNEGDLDPLNTALIDGGGGPQYFSDDLGTIFEGENSTPDLIFNKRPASSNDVVFLLE